MKDTAKNVFPSILNTVYGVWDDHKGISGFLQNRQQTQLHAAVTVLVHTANHQRLCMHVSSTN